MKTFALVGVILFASVAAAGQDAWLGLNLDVNQAGAHVKEVVAGSPAERAGVLAGDEVTSIDGQRVESARALVEAVHAAGVGREVRLALVDRDRHPRTLTVKLEPKPDVEQLQRTLVGHVAPDFEPTVQSGSKLGRISGLHGKVVLIDFFATWCGPCIAALPHVENLHEKLAKQGLAVVGVSTESATIVAGAARRFHLKYTLASDENEGVSGSYRVFALPTMVVIDRQGVVREVAIADVDAIDAAVEAALKAK
jgi:peroxiredoxin